MFNQTHALNTFHPDSANASTNSSKLAPPHLTINGTPAAIIQDIAGYQRLLDLAALADEVEGIRQAEEDPRSRPVEEFFAEFQERHGIPD